MTELEFSQSLEELGIVLSDYQKNQFNCYYALLLEWNQKMNLTSIIDKEQVYLKHFYDSATLVKVFDFDSVNSVCDVGTGAGFPGIVLKILFPHLKITLIDALQKRLTFLSVVVDALHLCDVTLVHERSEDYGRVHREKFDVVTARAVASLPVLLEYCIPILKKDGCFLPMKANIDEELEQSSRAFQILHCKLIRKEKFFLPKENSIRTLICVLKEENTDKKYPRKTVEIKKKPI